MVGNLLSMNAWIESLILALWTLTFFHKIPWVLLHISLGIILTIVHGLKLVTRASKLATLRCQVTSLTDLSKFLKEGRFHSRFVWKCPVELSSQQLHLFSLRVTEAVKDKEAIQWLVGVSWQPWGLRRRVTWHATVLVWVLHQRSCPWEVDLVSDKAFVELQVNASPEWKHLWALPCVQLSILSLENDNDCFSFKLKFFQIF